MKDILNYEAPFQVRYASGNCLEGSIDYENDNYKEVGFFRKIAMQTGLEGAILITGQIRERTDISFANAKSFVFNEPEIQILLEKI